MASCFRGALVVTMFLVVALQLHLGLNKFHAIEPSEACLLTPAVVPKVVVSNSRNASRSSSRSATYDTAAVSASRALVTTTAPQLQQIEKQGLNLPNSRELPEVNENGMIICVLHIPKTGGTTLSMPFEKHPHWRYRMVYGWNKQEKYRDEMYATLEDWKPGMKIYYEYHAGRSSAFMDLQVREDLLKWRAMAKVRNIPFFALTVIREPLSMSVSFFNYYYADRKGQDTRYFFVENPTEADFVRLSLPNPQCLFCVHTEVAYYEDYRRQGKPIHVPKEGCRAVYDAMLYTMDWIGTTETLSTETIPLIEHVANLRYPPHTRNKSKDKITKKGLSTAAVQHIRNITSFDLDLYQRAQQDFPMSMWSNLELHVPKPRPWSGNITHLHMQRFDTPDLLGIEARKKRREEKLKLQR